MLKKTLAILPVLFGASTASAQVYLQPVYPVLLPWPHTFHAHCHAHDWYVKDYAECYPIREQERAAGDAHAKSSPTTVIDANGQYRTGRRDLYDQSKVKGTSSETAFASRLALKRFTPPSITGASPRPEFEDADNPKIDSCDEYAYKRYYMVNRYLDTINGYLTVRNYPAAVNAILGGIPGVVQAPGVRTKACAALENARFVDFYGADRLPFSIGYPPAPHPTFTPQATGRRPKNEFFALSELLEPPPAGYIEMDPAKQGSYWPDFTAAYNASQVNAFIDDGPSGEFDRARKGMARLAAYPLPPAEIDDIAARKVNMRRALSAVGATYSRCLMKRMRDLTATSNIAIGTWQNLENVYIADPQQGWKDPIDLEELSLQLQLFNTSKASTALTTVLGADPKSLYLSGAWARSRTGSFLRALAQIDQNALASAVSATAYTVKSLSAPAGCGITDELDAVRDLVVAEWRLPGHGCYSGTKCDFNPKVFANDILARLQQYTYGQDDAKRFCTNTTSDDWEYGLASVPDKDGNRTSIDKLESFLGEKHLEQLAALRNTPHSSTLPGSIGDVRSGGSDWGSGAFGAGYSYRGEWAVNISEKGTTKNAFGQTVSCSVLGGRVDGALNAYATGFGIRKNLIDAGLTAKTKQGLKPATLSAHANILGQDLFTPIEDQALPSRYTADDENTTSFTLATAYVTVGPFPVKVSVAVGFDWGYEMTFGFSQSACSQKPTLSVGGEIVPYAGTNASVSAGVDLFVVGVGVRFTLTLVSASLPFDASVSVGPVDNVWSVKAKSNLALDLTELAGKVSLFITTFGATVMELELFSWPGLHQHLDLWHDDAVFPVNAFSLLGS